MSQETITVMIKKAGVNELIVKDIPNELEAMQAIVGGYIETIYLDGIDFVFNEEGRIKENPVYNFTVNITTHLFGDVFMCKHNKDGDFISLEGDDIEKIIRVFSKVLA